MMFRTPAKQTGSASRDEAFLRGVGAEHISGSHFGVTPQWAKTEARARGFRIIDVRNPDEFHGPHGHLPSAELVPLPTLAAEAASWNRSTPIVTVCRSGRRSAQALQLLEQAGFTRVVNMEGGLLALSEGVA